ncbi:hypothetical protein MC885_011284 [Smutsia gigantea]|nr:hypothetical protein MC885_011284 [Smutsia gigantea]
MAMLGYQQLTHALGWRCSESVVKQQENGVALKCFQKVTRCLDALGWEERQLALVQGLLAGNVFDWGAKAVSE